MICGKAIGQWVSFGRLMQYKNLGVVAGIRKFNLGA
jgi:hypothetical protein